MVGKVNKGMTISEVISRYPEAAEIMTDHGLHCVGCHVNPYESIEQGSPGHGMSPEKIDEMVDEINDLVKDHDEKKVIVSESALRKFRELMAKDGKPDSSIRLTVVPQGCDGVAYDVDFADVPEANDQVLEDNGLKIFVPKTQLAMVNGIRITYTESADGSIGFRILKPEQAEA